MNRLLTALLLITAAVDTAAGQTLSGTVRDPQERPIPSARVALVSRGGAARAAATSDASGQFRFAALAPGEYLLDIEARGFAAWGAGPIEIRGGEHISRDVRLEVAGVQTELVVTASGTAQTTDEAAKAVSIVDGEAIELRDEHSVTGALRNVPGLRIQQLGGPGALTSIKVRGMRNEDTAVLLDGFRLRDAAASQADASSMLQDVLIVNTDRIEVLRGSGSSIYGTNAMAGAINLVTEEGGGPVRGSLLAEGGALDMFRGRANLTGGLADNRLEYSLGAGHLNVASGVDGDDPARTSSGQGRLSYRLSPSARIFGRIFTADSFSKLNNTPQGIGQLPSTGAIIAVPLADVELRRFESGTPLDQLNAGSATFIPGANNPDNTRAGRFFSGAASLSINPGESIGFTASYHGLKTRRHYGDGPGGVGSQPAGSSLSLFDGQIHTAGARIDWRPARSQQINAGYEFENESYRSRSFAPNPAQNSAVNVAQKSSAVYAQDQFRLFDGRLHLALSYRAQFFALDQPEFAPLASAPYSGLQFESPKTGQTADAAIAWFIRRTGTKIRAHGGRGYRAPSLYERFGSFYGSFGYSAYGDPRLRPDRSISVDGGIDQSMGSRARLSATYFYTRLQEVIQFDFSGAITPAIDPYGRFGGYRNTGGGLSRGMETSGTISPISSLGVTAGYTYTDARQRTPLVPGIWRTYVVPEHQFFISTTQRLSERASLVFDFLSSSHYLASVYDPQTFSSRAYRFSGISRGQLGGTYRLPLGDSQAVRFFAKVDNLFNQTYYENGFRTPGAMPMGGLHFEF